MWRWLYELLNPADKCKRVGHKLCTALWVGWLDNYDSGTYFLPVFVRRKRKECFRCGVALSDWEIIKQVEYDEVSMPQEDWDQLEDTGQLCQEVTYERD